MALILNSCDPQWSLVFDPFPPRLAASVFRIPRRRTLSSSTTDNIKHCGPDEPWQAVTVWLGTQRTQGDLYPGGSYGFLSFPILSAMVSRAYPCGLGVLYNPSGSRLSENSSILLQAVDDHLGWPLSGGEIPWTSIIYHGPSPYLCRWSKCAKLEYSAGEQRFNDISSWIQLSDQTRDFVTPWLSPNQSFSYSSGKVAPVNASVLLVHLWEQHLIPSSSIWNAP